MNDSIKRITLDLHDLSSRETVEVKRSDTGRKICISLVDGGMPYHIAEGCYAVFTGRKPDNKVVYNDCTIEGNVIIYELSEQVSVVPGLVKCEVKLYGANDKLITSPRFSITVDDTVYNEGDHYESEDEIVHLSTLIKEATEAIDGANEAAVSAIEAADSVLLSKELGEFNGEKGDDGMSPYIGENGNWWVWDAEKKAYVDTLVTAGYDELNRKNLVAIANMTEATETLDLSAYEKGSISTGGVDGTYREGSRARTIGIHTSDYDKTLVSANGVEGIVVYFFDDDGNNISVVDWCATVEIPAGSHYRLLLSINPKAASTVVHELSEILANFYFVNEYKIVKQVEELAAEMAVSVNPYGTRISYKNYAELLPSMDDAEPNKLYSVIMTSTCKIANYPEGIGSATFVTLAPEIGEEKNTYKVQLLFEIGTNKLLLRANISNTWNRWTTLGEGGTGGAGATGISLYVATDGDDSADGSAAYPLATFNEAIRRGATTIIGEPGIYEETVSVSGVNNLTIRANKKKYDGSFQDGLNPKIILRNAEPVFMTEYGGAYTGIYRASFFADTSSRMYKVFVSKELPLTDDSGSEAEGYNANLVYCRQSNWLKMTPVATLEECMQRGDTFFYDGQYIYMDSELYAGEDVFVPYDYDVIANFENCDNLVLEDIQTEFGCVYGINIQNCRNATLTGCEAYCSTNGEGIRLDYTNARLSHCKSSYNRNDGFNMHENGYTELVNCIAKHNGDDGVSHHQGCSGTIIGGEYSYNGSGGITPAFGAEVNVYNAIMRYNLYGLQVLGATGYANRTIIAINNIIAENIMGGLYVSKNTVIGMNTFGWNGQGESDNIVTGTNGAYLDLPANA